MLAAGAVSTFTVPLVPGQEQDWPLWCWICPGVSAAPPAAFAGYETALSRRGGAPLIAPDVPRAPGTPTAVLRIGLVTAANAGLMFALSPQLQNGLGHSVCSPGSPPWEHSIWTGWRPPVRPPKPCGPTGLARTALSAVGAATGVWRPR